MNSLLWSYQGPCHCWEAACPCYLMAVLCEHACTHAQTQKNFLLVKISQAWYKMAMNHLGAKKVESNEMTHFEKSRLACGAAVWESSSFKLSWCLFLQCWGMTGGRHSHHRPTCHPVHWEEAGTTPCTLCWWERHVWEVESMWVSHPVVLFFRPEMCCLSIRLAVYLHCKISQQWS